MSEANGPYTVGTFAGNFVHVIRDGASVGPVFHSSSTVEKAAVIANLAHHHALAAQAERVKVLEDALVHIIEYWNRGENNGAMSDALYHMIETAEAALTPPAKGGT